jgi:hypothetical protein
MWREVNMEKARFKPGDRVRYMRHMGRFLATVTEAYVDRSTGSTRFFYRVALDAEYLSPVQRHPVPEKWLEPVGPLEELSFCSDAE